MMFLNVGLTIAMIGISWIVYFLANKRIKELRREANFWKEQYAAQLSLDFHLNGVWIEPRDDQLNELAELVVNKVQKMDKRQKL